MTITAILLTWG